MRSYDPSRPLIFVHVPKSAGTAVFEVFKSWFGSRLHRHYYDEERGLPPERLPQALMEDAGAPPVIYGHFNDQRGFGIRDNYPDIGQFVSILRDPVETMVSTYHFLRKHGGSWKDRSRVPRQDLADYIATTSPNILNHFPRKLTLQTYREAIDEDFIEIGITERLPESLDRIARKLGRTFDPAALDVVNATPRDQVLADEARSAFIEAHPLEYAVYDYARSRLRGPDA